MHRTVLLASVFVVLMASSLIAGDQQDYDRSEFAVFCGDTRSDGTSAFTLGVDYEYRWDSTAGMGLLFEYVLGDRFEREYLFGLPFYAHPYGGLRLLFAPVLVVEKVDDDTNVNRGLVRVGFAYGIDAGDFSITPEFNVDFLRGQAYAVYGLAFGYRF